MKRIESYKAFDGTVFLSYEDAIKHEQEKLEEYAGK